MSKVETENIREQLKDFIDTADPQKVKEIYTLLRNDLRNHDGYSEDLKAELDKAEEYYRKGKEMVSESEMHNRIQKIVTQKA